MKQYGVKITNRALDDMSKIYDYVATVLQAPDTALNLYDRIANEIETLSTLPERFKLFDSQPEREQGMRQLIVDNYSVIYVIRNNDVVVLRVLYSRSDLIARLCDNL